MMGSSFSESIEDKGIYFLSNLEIFSMIKTDEYKHLDVYISFYEI